MAESEVETEDLNIYILIGDQHLYAIQKISKQLRESKVEILFD